MASKLSNTESGGFTRSFIRHLPPSMGKNIAYLLQVRVVRGWYSGLPLFVRRKARSFFCLLQLPLPVIDCLLLLVGWSFPFLSLGGELWFWYNVSKSALWYCVVDWVGNGATRASDLERKKTRASERGPRVWLINSSTGNDMELYTPRTVAPGVAAVQPVDTYREFESQYEDLYFLLTQKIWIYDDSCSTICDPGGKYNVIQVGYKYQLEV